MSDVDISEAEASESDWTDISDNSFEGDGRGDDEEIHQCMYGNEPQYTAEELRNMDLSSPGDSEDSDSDDENHLDSSRLENLHWCGCGKCQIMPTLIESKCCKEFAELLGDKIPGRGKCITENEHFPDACLKTHILEWAYIQNRRYHNKFTETASISNRYVTSL